MSFKPRFAAIAVFATAATMALGGQAASAAPADPVSPGSSSSALIDVSNNNVGPVQACNNDVSVNVLGVQIPLSQGGGNAGGVDNDGNEAANVKDCEQETAQNNGGSGGGEAESSQGAEAEAEGAEEPATDGEPAEAQGETSDAEQSAPEAEPTSSSSLVNVSGNNVGPFQVCNNTVPVNVLGVQVPVDQLAANLGLVDNDGNVASNLENCEQVTEQRNGADEGGSSASLINVSNNNVGPFQVCNNTVPVDVLGVQVPVDQAAGNIGAVDNDGNAASNVEACAQQSRQGEDPEDPETPGEDPEDPEEPQTPGDDPEEPQTPGVDEPGSGGGDDAAAQSVLPDAGGPSALLLALGLLGLGAGATLIARGRRNAAS